MLSLEKSFSEIDISIYFVMYNLFDLYIFKNKKVNTFRVIAIEIIMLIYQKWFKNNSVINEEKFLLIRE